MNSQYEKNSIYIAGANYRIRRRERAIKAQLTAFLGALSVICLGLYAILFMVSQ